MICVFDEERGEAGRIFKFTIYGKQTSSKMVFFFFFFSPPNSEKLCVQLNAEKYHNMTNFCQSLKRVIITNFM